MGSVGREFVPFSMSHSGWLKLTSCDLLSRDARRVAFQDVVTERYQSSKRNSEEASDFQTSHHHIDISD
jgi:hypothetical protein